MELILEWIGGLSIALAVAQVVSIIGRVVVATVYQSYCHLRQDLSESWLKHLQWSADYRRRRDEFLSQAKAEAGL